MKTFSYYALVNRSKALGVTKKIGGTVDAAKKLGLAATSQIFPTSASGICRIVISILRQKPDILFVRFSDLAFPFIFFAILVARIRGQKVIIDVPTPRVIALKEFNAAVKNPLSRTLRKLWTCLSGPWVLYPAHKIIQYADESLWFSWGTLHKTVKVGNGVNIDKDLPLTKSFWPDSELRLIAVAQLASWHGYDRLINALALLKAIHPEFKVKCVIVGAGEELASLQSMVSKEGLKEQVTFAGMLTGNALDEVFEHAHVGVSSLCLYRKNVEEASDLKTREYMARGLPVLGVGKDPDIDDNSPFRFLVRNNNDAKELAERIYEFSMIELPRSADIRDFAEERLSLEGKLRSILGDWHVPKAIEKNE
ncbi:glycosyltransferase family 4 protein [Stutzerimonas xanthomarina]|uniref:glycosyltransferase family 4 protein n=1 Tax=Stutzerimonas xanthomarina TaxID=271420 RepID=UPI003AA8CD9B